MSAHPLDLRNSRVQHRHTGLEGGLLELTKCLADCSVGYSEKRNSIISYTVETTQQDLEALPRTELILRMLGDAHYPSLASGWDLEKGALEPSSDLVWQCLSVGPDAPGPR